MIDQIQTDITTAMKAREEQRLSTLRMIKTALKNKEIEKMAPLDDKESQQILTTLIKQRKESVEQFLKGGRKEMASWNAHTRWDNEQGDARCKGVTVARSRNHRK